MMSKPSKRLTLLSTLILLTGLAAGVGIVQAEQHGGGHAMHGSGKGMHGGHGGGKHGGGMPGAGKHGGCKHKGGKHGGMHSGGKHSGPRLYGEDWRKSLTDEQKAQLDRLHLAYARTKAPSKARMKALEVELTALATAVEPSWQVIDARIDELLQIKRQAMRAKYAYIADQRRVLTPEQQVSFDMQMIHKAMHGKKGKGGHH
jgi:Spy/CpxP family protein refolding chaperone